MITQYKFKKVKDFPSFDHLCVWNPFLPLLSAWYMFRSGSAFGQQRRRALPVTPWFIYKNYTVTHQTYGPSPHEIGSPTLNKLRRFYIQALCVHAWWVQLSDYSELIFILLHIIVWIRWCDSRWWWDTRSVCLKCVINLYYMSQTLYVLVNRPIKE